MDLEETLNHVVELAREELQIVRKRSHEKTANREHGHDYREAQDAADRLDHYAHQLHPQGWRKRSAADEPDRAA
jgi:hypothetical protein